MLFRVKDSPELTAPPPKTRKNLALLCAPVAWAVKDTKVARPQEMIYN